MYRLPLRSFARRISVFLCATSLFLTIWLGHPFQANTSVAQAVDARQLVQTGVTYYQEGNFLAALEPWLAAYQVYDVSQDLSALAIVSENLARAYQQMGRTSEEISYWEQAIETIQALGDQEKLGRLLTEQAQAYSRLGQHRRAITLLCGTAPDEGDCRMGSALQIALELDDALGQVIALGSLGEAYRSSGNTHVAIDYLKRGYGLSQDLDAQKLEASLLNSLGNTVANLALISYRRADEAVARSATKTELAVLRGNADATTNEAIDYFQKSYDLAIAQYNAETQLYALLNLIPAHERVGNTTAAKDYRGLALDVLQQLPDSKVKAFAAIKLADFLDPIDRRQSQLLLAATPLPRAVEEEATALLQQALSIGKAIANPRIISFSLGKLGHLDERAGRWAAAIQKTQEARWAADQDRAAQDSLYLWEWQLGRIYKAQGNLEDSGQAYGQAVELLQQIRSDILSSNRDLQFDFRDTVEPIYRQYATLSLLTVPEQVTLTEEEQSFQALETALTTLDSLKVAELQSYFANDCVIVPAQTRADAVGQSTATGVFSTALSEDQLTVILSLPDGGRKMMQVPVSAKDVEAKINEFRQSLELGVRDYRFNEKPAQQVYQWLIAPFEADLTGVKTLVFVNDGLLRSVPMAALHDGNQFLIETYAVATTPSLTLTTPEKVERTALNALLLGVSEPSEVPERTFIQLPAVETELSVLSQQLPNSKVLLNQEFSIEAVRKTLKEKDYRILHMATHGTFGFAPENNFIVVGAKQTGELSQYNEKLTIGQLDQLLREINDPTRAPIELLTLSACETGIGDNRSTLGLAGVAVRAGVRSAIATLWAVGDESTSAIVADFYDKLQDPTLTKAEALQQAQIAMVKSDKIGNRHPYRWAPFILIGNWL